MTKRLVGIVVAALSDIPLLLPALYIRLLKLKAAEDSRSPRHWRATGHLEGFTIPMHAKGAVR